jgi:hypothetical protein
MSALKCEIFLSCCIKSEFQCQISYESIKLWDIFLAFSSEYSVLSPFRDLRIIPVLYESYNLSVFIYDCEPESLDLRVERILRDVRIGNLDPTQTKQQEACENEDPHNLYSFLFCGESWSKSRSGAS